LILLYF